MVDPLDQWIGSENRNNNVEIIIKILFIIYYGLYHGLKKSHN